MILQTIKGRAICRCDWCGEQFFRSRANSRIYKHHFCNTRCCAQWVSKNSVGEKSPFFRRTISLETRKKISQSLIGKYTGNKNGHWRGGKIEKGNGYISIKKLDHPHCDKLGYVAEHRLVMEQFLGRYLEPEEVVHHIMV